MNSLVLRSAIVAALGGLLFGFETAVISGTTEDLERVYDIGGVWVRFPVATALLGTLVGALVAREAPGGRPILPRRDRPAAVPRPAGRAGAVQHRARHPAGVPVELRHREHAAGG